VGHALTLFLGPVRLLPAFPVVQLFSFARVRCTRAVRLHYFLIRQGGMGRTKALKNEVLGLKGNSSNLSQ